MTTYHKILLGLIAAAYFISPVDFIPDFFIPYLGWFDDTAVIAAILYFIKNGRFPAFFNNKKKGRSSSSKSHNFQTSDSDLRGKSSMGGGDWTSNSYGEPKSSNQEYSYKKNTTEQKSYQQNTAHKKSNEQESITKQEPSTKQPKSPYQILGLSPGASKEDIQSAYRQAVKQYHPDRVAHLGKELQDFANQKFIEIKEAYNFLNKIH